MSAAVGLRPNSSFAGFFGSSGLASGGSGLPLTVPLSCADAAPAVHVSAAETRRVVAIRNIKNPWNGASRLGQGYSWFGGRCQGAEIQLGQSALYQEISRLMRPAAEAGKDGVPLQRCRGPGMRRLALLLSTLAAIAFSTAAAGASVLVRIDKSSQRMTVSVDGQPAYSWPVSTGRG